MADRIAADGALVTYYTGVMQYEVAAASLGAVLFGAGVGLLVLTPLKR